MDRNKASVIIVGLLCGTALLWGIFLWPTPYRYETVSRPWYRSSKQQVYRVNRFTGTAVLVVDPTDPNASHNWWEKDPIVETPE